MECASVKLPPPVSPSIFILQGSSSPVCRNLSTKSLHPRILSSPLPKPFLQLNHRPKFFLYQPSLVSLSPRSYRGIISAEAQNQSWNLGRFLKTFYFFNGPPSPAKFLEFVIEKISGPSPSKPEKMETSGIVLVAGATGGVGRRVVDILRKKGLPVRALVRNEEKARKILGPDIDLVIGDITRESTLVPEYFKGVRKIINAVSVIVGPKEGDTPDRAKYSQGIKFFEPEIKGPSPEEVEYIGVKNLINAVKKSVGLRNGELLFGFEGPLEKMMENTSLKDIWKRNMKRSNNYKKLAWGALDDVVMGGVSESAFQIDQTGGENGRPTGIFKAANTVIYLTCLFKVLSRPQTMVALLVSEQSCSQNFLVPEDLSAYDGLELHLKGDGQRYKFMIRTSTDYDALAYTAAFDTVKDQWQSLMFSKFEYDGKLNPTFVEGAFQLPVSSIRAYIKDPITPRLVHVSAAGVTRPDRPGIDLSKQPPAVRLNKDLGFILTFKLKGEDLIRESGIPYAIVRPCALTEEPAGADLIFDQGDNITGKVSREEIALICIAALDSPYALDKTFEVTSVVPFSQPFTVDPENPPAEKDYNIYFKNLKDGITGKEALEQSPLPV
ncbi:hypothetical protein TIFTF001_012688 [Ficus carica]|uniref:NAD(P)-binding Rossmann-fold superfamily protein n=1 Tax=Ficus carica TaxID=3494 RepID=A0AA88ACS6_FICCA|nr:hypothetical protein TIFTF001_012688 [Ficus carica]